MGPPAFSTQKSCAQAVVVYHGCDQAFLPAILSMLLPHLKFTMELPWLNWEGKKHFQNYLRVNYIATYSSLARNFTWLALALG